MKKHSFIALLIFMVATMFQTNAQAPYKHGIGATVGSMQAFSYKTFPTDHFVIQLDLGTKYNYSIIAGYGSTLWTTELAASFMYEGHFVKGLYGFVGGGVSLGFSWHPAVTYYSTPYYYSSTSPEMQIWNIMGKSGAHGIIGLEYKFGIPLALQIDFRPGYRFQFNHEVTVNHTFDWGLVNLGVRYTF